MCVESNSWLKMDCMTTTGLSTQKLSLPVMSVTKHSGAKRNWHTTLRQHMLKKKVFIVTSNLERFNAFFIPQRKAIWGLTRKECMRKLMMSFPQNLCVVCVATEPTTSLTWTDIVISAKNLWIKILSITLVTFVRRSFLQRRSWQGTQNCTTELAMINQAVRLLVLFARKRLWTHGIWKDTHWKTMDSQKKAMSLKTVWGLQYLQQKRLLRRQWLKEDQRGFFTNVICVSTILFKRQILGDTNKSSMTEWQDQKCEEGKTRLALFLTEPNAEEWLRMQTTWQRERSRGLERI